MRWMRRIQFREAQGRLALQLTGFTVSTSKRRYYIWEANIGLKVKNDIKGSLYATLNCRREGIGGAEQSFEGQEELELP
jgi:hypothetical protein